MVHYQCPLDGAFKVPIDIWGHLQASSRLATHLDAHHSLLIGTLQLPRHFLYI